MSSTKLVILEFSFVGVRKGVVQVLLSEMGEGQENLGVRQAHGPVGHNMSDGDAGVCNAGLAAATIRGAGNACNIDEGFRFGFRSHGGIEP